VVSSEPIEGPAGGWRDPNAKRIAVEASLPANAQLRTLIHETAHPLGSTPQRHSGPQAEVILDAVVSAPVARNRGSGAGLNVGDRRYPRGFLRALVHVVVVGHARS
jgi:hypothetical protein